jgi:hypothetical protein
MDEIDDDDGFIEPASAAEQQMAEQIFDALKQLAPNAFISGNPRAGRMQLAFDGEFNLIRFVRLVASLREQKSHSNEA